MSSKYFLNSESEKRKNDIKDKEIVRHEELTPLGKSLEEGTACLSTPFVTFKVMTYNILAQTYMENHRMAYKNCPEKCLNWNYRMRILSQELATVQPDIFCLQEVEEERCYELLEPFAETGYDVLYVPREERPDGCAFLYSSKKFKIVDFNPIHYLHPSLSILDKPNVGMVTRLELCDYPGNYITVANTHLLYDHRRQDIKLSQLEILLAETDRLAFAGKPNKYHPVIISGDLNSKSDSCVIDLLQYGSLDMHSKKDCRRTVRIPHQLLQRYLNITPNCQYSDVVEGRRKGIKDVRRSTNLEEVLEEHRMFPYCRYSRGIDKDSIDNKKYVVERLSRYYQTRYGYLRHCFPLINVYEKPYLIDDILVEPKHNVIDYIFYSGKLPYRPYNPSYQPVKGQLELLSRLRLPSVSEHSVYFSTLPNNVCGSDHLPLWAKFLLPVY